MMQYLECLTIHVYGAVIEAIKGKGFGILGTSHPSASIAALHIPRALLDKEKKYCCNHMQYPG